MTRAVISGIGESELGHVPELSTMGITLDAGKKAVEDAGLTFRDIDGIILHPAFGVSPRYHIYVSEALGIFCKTLCNTQEMGGASYGAALQEARWMIENGRCTNVLILGGEKLRTGHVSGSALMSQAGPHHLDWEYPWGATVPAYYALLAQRYLYEYNLDPSALAQIAVSTRKHAHRNPGATMRDLITVDDVLNSRMISTPLHLLDCSLVSDGAAAYVVSREGTSKDPSREVAMLGIGQAQSYYHVAQLAEGAGDWDLVHTVIPVAAQQAFGEAGLSRDDLDFIEIYDSFTPTVAVQLEDLGFCGRGEAGDFVKEGNVDPDGRFPMNTHGGLLSNAHPGACGGMLAMTEAVRQIRGEAGEHQVAKHETALVTSVSAVASNFSVTLLGPAHS